MHVQGDSLATVMVAQLVMYLEGDLFSKLVVTASFCEMRCASWDQSVNAFRKVQDQIVDQVHAMRCEIALGRLGLRGRSMHGGR